MDVKSVATVCIIHNQKINYRMSIINENFLKLQNNYLFSEINKRVNEYLKENPDAKLIRMGIGDVTQPISKAALKGMHDAVDRLSSADTMVGYGPEQGYADLRSAIAEYDFKARGVEISPDEVFISDGAKSDTANIVDLFSNEVKIAITDPVYPVYVDSNVISGRVGSYQEGKWSEIVYLPCNAENKFVPALPEKHVNLIYLCFPNNPTGAVLTKEQLKRWVDYALKEKAIILYDAAYVAFIREEGIPHSIFEIEGAKECAIEFRSYSKTAGFTGVRCGYTVVPKELKVKASSGEDVALHGMWKRRQTTKFNGASFISQQGALAIYTEEGRKEIRETVDYYLNNAKMISDVMSDLGFEVYGAQNSPYVWIKVPEGQTSWSFFDYLLREKNLITTPGVGFGPEGEGYIRFSSFGDAESVKAAMERLKQD